MAVSENLKYFLGALSLLPHVCLQCPADEKLQFPVPIIINTWNFTGAHLKAYSTCLSGGNALDAVEAGCTFCERWQCSGTVGYGGSPDENGETTLDAMIMDGKTMKSGAVGALREIKNAVSVARRVLEHTDHSLLVGSQATEFALEMGFVREPLSTNESKAKWETWKTGKCQPNFWKNVIPSPETTCGPYHSESNSVPSSSSYNHFCENNHDTIGMVVMDLAKNLAVATSSNGAIHKIPGRVGDAPLVGSGGYVENGVGGAAATGDGDVMMRFLPSFKAVEGLRRGLTPTQAAQEALRNIKDHFPQYKGALVVLSASGEYGAACHGFSEFPFIISKAGAINVITIQC